MASRRPFPSAAPPPSVIKTPVNFPPFNILPTFEVDEEKVRQAESTLDSYIRTSQGPFFVDSTGHTVDKFERYSDRYFKRSSSSKQLVQLLKPLLTDRFYPMELIKPKKLLRKQLQASSELLLDELQQEGDEEEKEEGLEGEEVLESNSADEADDYGGSYQRFDDDEEYLAGGMSGGEDEPAF
ncbi:hypothetical protein RCL1_007197 [Eukaryota sp. TZLM3-RCL]